MGPVAFRVVIGDPGRCGSESRGSVLGIVDDGRIGRGHLGAVRTVDDAFSTRGGFQLCAGLSVVASGLAWLTLESPGLTAFGMLAPLPWLYG